ncbi:MAG: hypothetical protein AAGI90_04070 [Chlamydiota bacterium]
MSASPQATSPQASHQLIPLEPQNREHYFESGQLFPQEKDSFKEIIHRFRGDVDMQDFLKTSCCCLPRFNTYTVRVYMNRTERKEGEELGDTKTGEVGNTNNEDNVANRRVEEFAIQSGPNTLMLQKTADGVTKAIQYTPAGQQTVFAANRLDDHTSCFLNMFSTKA